MEELSLSLSLSKFDNVDFCSSLAGCAFLTYVERASAEKAQKALHERITLPGVSESLRFLYSSNRNGIYFNYSFRRRPPKHTNSMEKPGMMFWHNFRLYPKQNYIRLSSSVPRNWLACLLACSFLSLLLSGNCLNSHSGSLSVHFECALLRAWKLTFALWRS